MSLKETPRIPHPRHSDVGIDRRQLNRARLKSRAFFYLGWKKRLFRLPLPVILCQYGINQHFAAPSPCLLATASSKIRVGWLMLMPCAFSSVTHANSRASSFSLTSGLPAHRAV